MAARSRAYACDVLGRQRLLQPEDVERRQSPGGTARGRQVPQLVRVEHQQPGRADDTAHSRDPVQVLLEVGQPDLDLEPGMAGLDPAGHLLDQLVQCQMPVHPAGIHRYLVTLAADQLGQAQPGRPGLQVPQADVDRGHGERGDAAARLAQPPPHAVPGRGRGDRPAQCEPGEIGVDHRVDRLRSGLHRPAEALPGRAVARLHGGRDEVLAGDAGPPGHRHRQLVRPGLQPGHLRGHDSLPASNAGRQNSPPR